MSDKTTRNLPVKLTDQEKLHFGREESRLVREVAELEAKKRMSAADFKAQIELRSSQIRDFAEKVHTGVEYREVECVATPIFSEGIMRITRRDTGEVVQERCLTKQEQQARLEFVVHGADSE